MDSHQTGNSLACLIFTSHGMSRSLRRNHGHIHVCGGNNLSEMNIEAMGEHQHISLFQVRFDVLLVHGSLQFIVDQDHNDICLLCSFCRRIYFKALCFCFCPGSGAFIQTDNDVASGLLCVQCVCMSLAAVTDHCDCLAFQQGKVTIFLVKNLCHFLFLHFYSGLFSL